MSNMLSQGLFRTLLAGVAVAICLSVVTDADAESRRKRNDSYVDEVSRKTEILVQKIEDEVTNALVKSRRQGASNPSGAVSTLRRTLGHVEDNTALTDARREVLVKLLKDRIRYWSNRAEARVKDRASREDRREGLKRSRSDEDDARREETDNIRKSLRRTREDLREARQIRREREAGRVGVFREIERSAIPTDGVVTFPKDWKKRVAKRTPVLLTKKEKAILRILNSVISVDFKDQSFDAVIDYLQEKTGQPILVDKQALADANIEYETPVTLKLKKVSVRTLLRKLLHDLGLTYVIKDEIIQVTSYKRAKEMMTVRTYPVGDLVSFDPTTGQLLPPALIMYQANQLIQLIKSTIDPDSWGGGENGGGGTIVFNLATKSLVVKQSAEIHYSMKASFGR
jgi:hypothetical protein